jgi:hypothetical protein
MTTETPEPDDGRGKSVAEIEREIDRTRAELGAVLGAIERQIGPRQLLERGADMLKETLGGGGGMVGETMRNHPLPLALIGAGLGWLLVEATAGSGTEGIAASSAADGEYAYARTKTPMGDAAGGVDGAPSRTRDRIRRGIEENPLALGVIGLLAGAALGLLLPKTKVEERWLGKPPAPVPDGTDGG